VSKMEKRKYSKSVFSKPFSDNYTV